jgi:ppGpp synthetase/RelA/SpoT-type nucleotidyltranferase
MDLTKKAQSDCQKIEELKEEYSAYSLECEAAMDVLLARIRNLQRGMTASKERILIDGVTNRVKTFDSCIAKLRRNKKELTAENLRSLRDVAGIRVITPFRDDIYTVVRALENQTGIYIERRKDYVANPKENGYMSYHLTILMETFFLDRKVNVPVEVQIRDVSMNLWASLEHTLNYKKKTTSPTATKAFKELAEYLTSFDDKAIELRKQLRIK